MSNKWTSAQLTAIESRDKTLLLSAAAGSGKTSTLTERIIRSLTDKENPADISKMLIVTFTRASAADLKTKIFNALNGELAKNPSSRHLSSQLIKLGSAKISTIDAFYLSAVRSSFAALGLSSSFRIADESESVLIAKSVMSDTTNRFYETHEEFWQLCDCFEKIRDTEGAVEEILLSLYTDCLRTPEGIEYLKICADSVNAGADCDFFDTSFGALLKKYAHMCIGDYLAAYEQILEKMPLDEHLYAVYGTAFEEDRIFCIRALNILEGKENDSTYAAICTLFDAYSLPSLKSIGKHASEYSIFCKTLRDRFKADFAALRERFFCYTHEDFSSFFTLTSQHLSMLYRVLSEFDKAFSAEKKRRGILELTDVKRYALQLFVNSDGTPTDEAIKFSSTLSHIYIDEYQDVDPVQDLIFRSIATPTNRFMVGDIKQSIYSFRGARPKLFADYRSLFPTHGTPDADSSNCETIFMSENFRCSRSVIDFTNLVCSDIFRACGDSVGYTDGDDLVYAKKLSEDALPDKPVTLAVFAKRPKKELDGIDTSALPSPAEAEARYIAHEIKTLLASGKKQDGSRVQPCDIAVLYRSNTMQKRIAAALSEVGVLTSASDASQYFSNPEVTMMLCILNAIDNPQRDIYLSGALCSPIFGFSMDDLLTINRYGTPAHSLYDKLCLCAEDEGELPLRLREFCRVLDTWRCMSASLPIDKLLSRIFASDAFLASGLVCEKNARGEGGNLLRLYDYARTFESGSYKGLYSFIEFINTLIENGKTIDAHADNASEDCVTLTTIHKSKGLEFPICFVCGAAAPFNTSSSGPALTFEYGAGVAMTLSDSTGFAKYASPLKRVLDLDGNFRGVEEEMRVLYVALTRAKEQLYVTGSYPMSVMSTVLSDADFSARMKSRYFKLTAKCYMDWILPAVGYGKAEGFVKLLTYTTDALPDFSVTPISEPQQAKIELDSELYEQLRKNFEFSYPYADIRTIPAKLSVSKLSPDILDKADISVDLFDSEKSTAVPDFFLGGKAKASASERGTATHLFLQFCDFAMLAEQGAQRTTDFLVQRGFIPQSIADCIYTDEIDSFAESALIKEILSAKKVIREQRFNLLLSASDFSLDKEIRESVKNEKIAVQGVIDLIVITEDGNLCLYDYKTDRLSTAELKSKQLAVKKMNTSHALQLSYYAEAVRQLFGRPADRVAVYSTHAAQSFDIDICDLQIPNDIV